MNAENCKTKLTSELIQGNVNLNYNNSNKKSYILILSPFSIFYCYWYFIICFIIQMKKPIKISKIISKEQKAVVSYDVLGEI